MFAACFACVVRGCMFLLAICDLFADVSITLIACYCLVFVLLIDWRDYFRLCFKLLLVVFYCFGVVVGLVPCMLVV